MEISEFWMIALRFGSLVLCGVGVITLLTLFIKDMIGGKIW